MSTDCVDTEVSYAVKHECLLAIVSRTGVNAHTGHQLCDVLVKYNDVKKPYVHLKEIPEAMVELYVDALTFAEDSDVNLFRLQKQNTMKSISVESDDFSVCFMLGEICDEALGPEYPTDRINYQLVWSLGHKRYPWSEGWPPFIQQPLLYKPEAVVLH